MRKSGESTNSINFFVAVAIYTAATARPCEGEADALKMPIALGRQFQRRAVAVDHCDTFAG